MSLKQKLRSLVLSSLVSMSVLSVGATVSAQVENITKTPNLSQDIQEFTQYDPLEIPSDYPQELKKKTPTKSMIALWLLL